MAAQPQQFKAFVKSVLSGDTFVLRGRPGANDQPAKERILHLAAISAPRMGSSTREDESFAFASREYLRALLVNKEVFISVLHSVKSSDNNQGGSGVYATDIAREYGVACIAPASPGLPPQDIATLSVSAGWARVRDSSASEDASETARKENLRAAEAAAQAEARGIWSGQEVQRTVNFSMADSQAFLQEWRGKPIDAIVEQVRDGSQLRVRLLVSETEHQFVTLSLAGIKAPRTGGQDGNGEPFSEESRAYVEARLLQRQIKVVLLSSPASLGASPLSAAPTASSNGSGLPPPPPASNANFIGLARHPAGDIAAFLVAAGLAKVLDWHAGLLSNFGGMDKFRSAEKSAKDRRVGIWTDYTPPAPVGIPAANGKAGAAAAPEEIIRNFEGIVVRVWGADQLSVVEKGSETERRVQLSSVRGPRPSDPKQAYWANEAKEFLRKKLIGKTVQVTVDYIKPREGEFDERTCVTIRFGGAHTNIAELLLEKGLASVLRHRRDDESRSPDLDKLVIAEQTAVEAARGIHSGKELTAARIIDVSESGSKATQFLPFFKRAGKQAAIVDFVASGSRFKVLLPKEDKKLTFVLAGIRAPRTARNPSEKAEPFGPESLKFANQYMQRDVEIEFDSVDKTGGYIGTMYLNKTENAAVELVRAGLATVHAFSAEALPYGKQLFAAEEDAKRSKRNIWNSYDPGVEEAAAAMHAASLAPAAALPTAYFDVIVSNVRTEGPFSFSVQVLNAANNNGAALQKMASEFANYHKTPAAKSPAGWAPRAGDIVSGQFTEDNQWYRARVKRASALKKECEVVFVDYGNEETLPFSRVRPLDAKFKTLPPQAQDARLSFVKLVKPGTEYALQSLDRFRDFAEGRKLIANTDFKEGSLLHLRLIDPEIPQSTINADILREGLASLDTGVKYFGAYKAVVSKLEEASNLAKRERLGQFEFGDTTEDD